MTLTVATWNMNKRAKAVKRLPELLKGHGIDVLMAQEAPGLVDPPTGYESVYTPDPRPDTAILAREGLLLTLADESPLRMFESFAAVATISRDGAEFILASAHSVAAVAPPSMYAGFDADAIKRDGVDEPWRNDVVFAGLEPFVRGRRFVVGADLNTSRLFPGGPAFFDRAAAAGWVDVVWRARGEQVPTFLTSRSNAHQLDYIFVDQQSANGLQNVEVLTDVTDLDGDGSSDHAMLVASLELD